MLREKQGAFSQRDIKKPTDIALIVDPKFKKWVEIYARDKEKFYADFANAFAKLVELGIQRDAQGNVMKKGMQDGKAVWIQGQNRVVESKEVAKL